MSSRPSSEKIELWSNSQERKMYEDLAELYAILRTCEFLELAHSRDAIATNEEYTENCEKLITQFKSTERALIQSGAIESLDHFLVKFQISDCPRAVERMKTGLNFASSSSSLMGGNPTSNAPVLSKRNMQLMKELTELFITCSNMIALGHLAVDQLTPQLDALCKTLEKSKVILFPNQELDTSVLTQQWLQELNTMRASDTLDGDQARQLQYDLEKVMQRVNELLLVD